MLATGVLAAAALVLALLVTGPAAAAPPCWKQVINDWSDNSRIDKSYAAQCYDKAIDNLPPDVYYYSEAPDTIERAKQAMLRAQDRRLQSVDPNGSGTSSVKENSSGGTSSSDKGDGDSPLGAALTWGPSAADDVPLPLLIIAFLALLLMGAGAAALVNRRLQARRAGPPPVL